MCGYSTVNDLRLSVDLKKTKTQYRAAVGCQRSMFCRAASDAGKKGFKLYRTLTGETVDAVQCYKKKHVVFLLVRAAEIEKEEGGRLK